MLNTKIIDDREQKVYLPSSRGGGELTILIFLLNIQKEFFNKSVAQNIFFSNQ